jgi:branched-chain amino acid transport system substrate-binding protein
VESAKAMGQDYPFGIWGNSYDVFNWEAGPKAHKDYIGRIKAYTKEEVPSSWPLVGYMAMQALVAGIEKAKSTDSDKVAAALKGVSWESPLGKQTLRAKDHNANRGQFWGKMQKDAKHPFAIMTQIQYVDPLPFMD